MSKRSALRPALLCPSVVLLLIITALPLDLTAGEIYTWIDAHGVTHFTDQRPAAQGHEVIRPEALQPLVIDNPRRTDPPPAAPSPPSAAERSRAAAASRARSQHAQAAERRAQQCQAQRDRLEQVQARLRAGYGVAEGNRLRSERRELRSRLHSDC